MGPLVRRAIGVKDRESLLQSHTELACQTKPLFSRATFIRLFPSLFVERAAGFIQRMDENFSMRQARPQ